MDKVLEYQREYRTKNRDKVNSMQRKYAATVKGKAYQSVRRKNRRDRIFETDDGTITTEALERLFKEQGNKCYHCGKDFDYDTQKAIHLDHLVPLSKGGGHTISNVRWSCAFCNLSKGSKLI